MRLKLVWAAPWGPVLAFAGTSLARFRSAAQGWRLLDELRGVWHLEVERSRRTLIRFACLDHAICTPMAQARSCTLF